LKPLYQRLTLGSVNTRTAILQCYTGIVEQYATFDWPEYDRAAEAVGDASGQDVQMASAFVPIPRADYMRTIYELVTFVDSVCSVAVHMERNALPLVNRVIDFYEVSSRMNREFDLPLTLIPSHVVAYYCLLTPSLDVLSRFCGVLSETYEDIRGVKLLAKKNPEIAVANDGLENVDYFNFFLKDFACMLYLQSVLHRQPTAGSILFNAPMFVRQNEAREGRLPQLRAEFRETVLEMTKPLITEDTIGDSLDVTRLFPGHAFEFLAAMQKKAGPGAAHITLKREQINTSDRFRAKFLSWLGKEQGATGLQRFLSEHVGKLQAQ